MLVPLPVFDRIRTVGWARAAMRDIGPAVIGVLAVSLLRLAPHARPDPFAVVLLGVTVIAIAYWRVGTWKLMLGGSLLGVLRNRFASAQLIRSVLSARF